jgi:DNA modification methylase
MKKKRANELDGKTWLRYSISIWSDLKKTKEESQIKHPAMFPTALVGRLIECFMNQDDRLVFDPFSGIGSTLIAAKEHSKDSIGIEISPEFARITENRLTQIMTYSWNVVKSVVYIADSRDTLKYVGPNSVDLVITSPPYWNILLEKRTADYKEQRDYGDMVADLGKISNYNEFLSELHKIFEQVYIALKPGKYCCVVVMDLRKKNRFYPYHMDVTLFMQEIGFIFDDIIIWDRRQEYNSLRPLGYPNVFRINKSHEYILIFKKPEDNIDESYSAT